MKRANTNAPTRLALAAAILVVFTLGALIAAHRPMWGDEAYSISRTFFLPWLQYLAGDSQEGNSAPLYYLLLKTLVIFQPYVANLGVDSLLWVRLLAVLPAVGIAVVIFNLAHRAIPRYSAFAGFAFALFFAGSYTFREYVWPSRQYALWLLASTIQTKMLLEQALEPRKEFKPWPWFFANTFLAAAMAFAPVQIVGGGLTLLLAGVRFKSLTKYAAAGIVPVIYTLVSRAQNGEFLYIWPGLREFRFLIMANARWTAFGTLLILLFLLRRQKQTVRALGALLIGMAAMCGVLIFMFWTQREKNGWFQIPDRYFIFTCGQMTVALLFALKVWFEKGQPGIPKNFANAAAFAVPALFLAIGVKGIAAQAPEWSKPVAGAVVRQALAPIAAATTPRCLCADQNAKGASYIKWMHFIFEIRDYNRRLGKCDPKSAVHLRFLDEGEPPWRIFPNVIPKPDRESSFHEESGLCYR